MIRWYADNSELRDTRGTEIPNVLLFGGLVAGDEARTELCSILKSIKSAYRRKADFPIKWCFKDLKKRFVDHRLLRLYSRLLEDSFNWRTTIFRQLSSVNFKIIASIITCYGSSRPTLLRTKEDVARFGFSNALQRLGLFVQDTNPGAVEAILDWPNKGKRSPFDIEYWSAYHKGTTAIYHNNYSCGPLKDLGFSESALFTSTDECSLLQLSDLILGATKEMVEEALGGRQESLGVSLLRSIRDRFHGAPDTVVGRGISISPRQGEFFEKVKDKINGLFR
jgi:hypothetical protein